MVIRNFDFPSVTLRQVFESQDLGRVPDLGVLCVGPQYRLHRSDDGDAAPLLANSGEYRPSTGLIGTLPGHGSDTVPDLSPEHIGLAVRNGVFKYASDASGNVEGNAVTCSQVVCSGNGYEAHGAWFGTRGVKVGDPVYLTADGRFSGKLSRVVRIEFTEDTGFNKLVLDTVHGISGSAHVDFCVYMDADFGGDSGFISVSGPDQVRLAGDIQAQLPELDGKSGSLQSGDLYVEYRERVLSQINALGSVSNPDELEEQLGEPCAENPLALACAFALMASKGELVYYTTVRDDTPAAYEAALGATDKYIGVYSVVPCTEDPDVVRACVSSCEASSMDKESVIRRAVWFGITQDEAPAVVSGRASWASTGRLLTFDPGISCTFREGDKVRFGSKPGQLFAIESFDGLVTYTLAQDEGLPKDIEATTAEIVREDPTPADIVANVISKRCVQTERAVAVWADGLVYNGERLPNYPLAAAAAGMRSYEPVHRPLSNLSYQFFGLTESNGLSTGMLRQIGAEGIWIVGTDSSSFVPVNRRQVTTAASGDVNRDEESVIANIDSIAMQIAKVGRNLVGSSNISPALITLLSDSISSIMDSYLVNSTDSAVIGPQLTSWELNRIWQDPVSLDRIYASISATPPKPFNQFDMTMRVI